MKKFDSKQFIEGYEGRNENDVFNDPESDTKQKDIGYCRYALSILSVSQKPPIPN